MYCVSAVIHSYIRLYKYHAKAPIGKSEINNI